MRFLAFLLAMLFSFQAIAKPMHGAAMHGDLKYPPTFTHFDYVNPSAPKGGTLRQSSFGSFDTFNPFVLRGNAAPGIGMLFETLMVESLDEPFSEYGLIAEKIDMPDDRSWVAFDIDPRARFHDGSMIGADDVVFSFHLLKEKGAPQYRYYYGGVDRVESITPLRVKFTFVPGYNRELPLILGQMPVLSKSYWGARDFDMTTLDVPMGSGPYRIKSFKPGREIVYERDPNYWGRDLPVNKGQYNFDEIRYDIYRDTTVAVEAFKAGAFDVRIENESKKWATAYDFPAVKDGRVIKRSFSHQLPSGMQGFVFNTRRPIFADIRVRQALSYAFDFDWSNKNLFYGMYKRTTSYFDNSELAYQGMEFPSAQNGNMRPLLMQSLALLEQAGWTVQEGVLKNASGQLFEFEILLDTSGAAAWERITLPYLRNLKKLGIHARIRVMDVMQYKHRLDTFDYDMFVFVWGQSLSPGNEQKYYWSSSAADQPGSYNFAGIKDPQIDALIDRVIAAETRPELIIATQALDRTLLSGYYVIPHWHQSVNNVIYWNKFGMPEMIPMKGFSVMTWWAK